MRTRKPRHRQNALYRAVSDPIRRRILDRLADGPLEAGAIARQFTISRPAISRHLRLLRRATLVSEEKRGRTRIYRLTPLPLQELDEWLTRYRLIWSVRLIDLKNFVEGKSQ